MSQLYISARHVVRSLLLRFPGLDRRFGKALVQVDLNLRHRGALGSALDSGVIEYDGLILHFDPRQPDEAAAILTNGTYEPDTIDVIRETLTPGSTFVDLGCHIGLMSLVAARCVGPTGAVHAFEPTPDVGDMAVRNFKANGLADRIRLEPAAVGAFDGDVRLHIEDGASQANSVIQGEDNSSSVVVRMTTLDSYFGHLGWPPVDLVKMDIEGQELAAIGAMRGLVERNPRVALIFEYHRAQMRRSGTTADDLFGALNGLGFDTFTALFRGRVALDVPTDLDRLEQLASRSNLNILAQRSS